MAITIHGEQSSSLAGLPTWGYDEAANMDIIPIAGNVGINQTRSIGKSLTGTGAAPAPFQVFANQLLPGGLLMVQTVPGAETNTFTTRVAVNGTFVNTCNAGTQVAGTINAGLLNVLGRTLKIKAFGTLGTNVTPDYTIDVGLGSGVLATTGACTMTASTSPAPWYLDVLATVTATGATGTIISMGTFAMANASNAATKTFTVGNSTPGTGLTADLTAALALTLNWTSSASHANNRTRCYGMTVELLG